MAGDKPRRIDDKRISGRGNRVPYTVAENSGAGKPLAIFNDRRNGKTNIGKGRKAF